MIMIGGEIGVMMMGAMTMGWIGVISPGDVSVVPGSATLPGG